MNSDFKRQMEYCNIPVWHSAGIKGKGIVVFMDDVGGGHAANTSAVVQTILPEATVLSGNIGVRIKSGIVEGANVYCEQTGETMYFEEFITKHNVRIINNSKDGGDHDKDSPKAVWLREMRDKYNLILTASAGNGTGRPIDNSFYGAAIVVNGCRLNGNTPVWGRYAKDKDIDFSAFTAGLVGTSFAAPFFAGMSGLLLCKHPNWTQGDIYTYFQNNCIDLGSSGIDEIYGFGLAILGDVNTMKIMMKIGDKMMYVNSKPVEIDQPPMINPETDRTLVPVRAIAEALGMTVEWKDKEREIILHG